MKDKKVKKSGLVFGFSIAALVLLCVNIFIGFIYGASIIAALNVAGNEIKNDQDISDLPSTITEDIPVLVKEIIAGILIYNAVVGIAGIITLSIFLSRYVKQGYDMKSQMAFYIVFIVFSVIGGWGIFSLVTGILGIIFRNKPQE